MIILRHGFIIPSFVFLGKGGKSKPCVTLISFSGVEFAKLDTAFYVSGRQTAAGASLRARRVCWNL